MKNPVLDGARAKIQRAGHHLREIDEAIGQLWAAERDSTSGAFPGHKMDEQHLIVYRPHSAPLDPSFALMVGDFIHNVRSALDHLVFQLAQLHGAPAAAADKTTFPVCLTKKAFDNISKSKLVPFISPAALAEIEKFQPYSTGDAEQDVLWVLSKLDIIDKHRLLIVTKSKVRPTRFTFTAPTGHQASAELPEMEWKPADAGTELIRFDLSGTALPAGEMKVNITTAMTVQIENSGLVCDGMIVQAVLADSIQHTVNTIDHFGKVFFSE